MKRLTPLSYAFLAAEDVDPTACLVIGSLAVLDGPAPRIDELRTLVASRLPTVPRYAQRVVPGRFGLRAPSWQEAPALDLRQHVTERRVPAPGGRAEVATMMAQAMAERMDRDRPLWDVTLCDGLADGRWAVLSASTTPSPTVCPVQVSTGWSSTRRPRRTSRRRHHPGRLPASPAAASSPRPGASSRSARLWCR